MPGPIDWIHALAGAITAGVAAIFPGFAVIRANHERSKKNKRRLEGDPNDPNAEGVLEIAHETRRQVEKLDEKIETVKREARHNRQAIIEKLDRIEQNGSNGEIDSPEVD